MSTAPATLAEINKQRYDAVLRISEALSACTRAGELAKILAEQLGKVIPFEHLDVVVLKENSNEIEYHVCGKAALPVADLPVEKLLTWHVYNSQEPLHITDWNTDERVPEQLKDAARTIGINVGSVLLVPLTTPHRRLGTLGISCVLLRALSHLRLMTVLICDARRQRKRHYNSKTSACSCSSI